ncbi:MAG: alpha-glucan family phosphorylase, partial [Bacteroidales bacterium]|nr:alpha-glucan family phosphorylase [Bacteroidales bacterium]
IAQVACNFTTNRMLSDYVKQYYEPQSLRYESLIADDFGKARQMAAWKKKLRCQWNDIEVISMTKPDSSSSDLTLGKPFKAEAVVAIGTLKPEDIGVEVLFAKPDKNGKMHITEKYELTPSSFKEGVATYSCEVSPERSGVYRCSARIFAKNPEMPHRQDFELVKWL